MKILVTGGAGFIGSNFIPYFLEAHPNYHIVNLDKLTYAGNLSNLQELEDCPRYSFVKGDIQNQELLKQLFQEYNFDGVIHFAAESHVDNSILGPSEFIQTNIVGTFQLLEVVRQYPHCRFHHISTDEVYGSLGPVGLFSEDTAYAPNSPYSASKASSDFLVRSYFHTYNLNLVTTNCSNNYGPKQHQEKLIPTIIGKALSRQPIPIYGDGQNIRDWLYVLDHCRGIDLVFHEGRPGESYNIGGQNERTNLQVVHSICDILDQLSPIEGSYRQFITFVTDRPGHDRRYAIDATKLETELGWKAQESFETGILKTVEWYLQKIRMN